MSIKQAKSGEQEVHQASQIKRGPIRSELESKNPSSKRIKRGSIRSKLESKKSIKQAKSGEQEVHQASQIKRGSRIDDIIKVNKVDVVIKANKSSKSSEASSWKARSPSIEVPKGGGHGCRTKVPLSGIRRDKALSLIVPIKKTYDSCHLQESLDQTN